MSDDGWGTDWSDVLGMVLWYGFCVAVGGLLAGGPGILMALMFAFFTW